MMEATLYSFMVLIVRIGVLTLRAGGLDGIKQMQVHVIFVITVVIIIIFATAAAAITATNTRWSWEIQVIGRGFPLQFQYLIDRLILL
jgi:hypothetical protein